MKLRDLINKIVIRALSPSCRPDPSDDKILVMFAGHAYNGNLKSLYEELRSRQTFGGKPVEIYWVVKKKKDVKKFRAEKVAALWYYNLSGIPKFLKAAAWLNDRGKGSIPVTKQPGSLWVDVGHAIPFKNSAGDREHKKGLAEFDLHPVSSPWFKEYYASGIGLASDKVVVTGYPRIDRLLKPGYYNRERIITEIGFKPDQPIILYAPTWEQENKGGEPLFPFGDDGKFLEELDGFLEKNRMQMIIRLHPKWKGWTPQPSPLRQSCLRFHSAKTDWDAEKYLSVTDVLITDWSSIANDFLVLDRPIVFLDNPPKFFYYGYLIPPEERPGAIVKTKEGLFGALVKAASDPKEYSEKRRALREKVHFGLDGQASARTIAVMEERLGK